MSLTLDELEGLQKQIIKIAHSHGWSTSQRKTGGLHIFSSLIDKRSHFYNDIKLIEDIITDYFLSLSTTTRKYFPKIHGTVSLDRSTLTFGAIISIRKYNLKNEVFQLHLNDDLANVKDVKKLLETELEIPIKGLSVTGTLLLT